MDFISNKHLRVMVLCSLTSILILPIVLYGQIETQVRDSSPGLFTNQRLIHSPPKPFFKNRIHNLDFITDIPKDSILTSTLFLRMKHNSYFQEHALKYSHGLFRFTYDPKVFPGTDIEYYFVIKTPSRIYGTPIDDNGQLSPVKKLLIDPVQYYKQQSRLNK